MRAFLQKAVLRLVMVSMMICAPLAPAYGGIVGTDTALAMSERAQSVERINAVLMRDDVRSQLEAMGVDPADAMERVDSLTNAELAQLENRIGELPAGGDVLAVLGVVLVVLLVLELLGVTNVFTGV